MINLARNERVWLHFLKASSNAVKSVLTVFTYIITIFAITIGVCVANLTSFAQVANAYEKSANNKNSNSGKIIIRVKNATPVVTGTSGYHITFSIESQSGKLPAGRITLATNTTYKFVSSTDLQNWAQGKSRIQTPQYLGFTDVSELAEGKSETFTIDIPADNAILSSIKRWGPKPVSLIYHSKNYKKIEILHTFMTRSQDGLYTADSNKLHITPIIPLLAQSSEWQANLNYSAIEPNILCENRINDSANMRKENTAAEDNKTDSSVDKNNPNAESNEAESKGAESKGAESKNTDAKETEKTFENNKSIISLNKNAIKRLHNLEEVVKKHAQLQTIAEKNTLSAAHLTITPSAFMQPAGFDISAYADDNNDKLYESAGINKNAWSAKLASESNPYGLYCANINQKNTQKNTQQNEQNNSKIPTYAWQTHGKWTHNALEAAKNNGYDAVIATSGFDTTASHTEVNKSVYDAQTTNGYSRVLISQNILSTLANDNPTSQEAAAEETQSGRISRLIAQSAFYKMQQPGVSRNMLISFASTSSKDNVDNVMSALEQASWLDFSDINSLSQSSAYQYGKKPDFLHNSLPEIPQSSDISSKDAAARSQLLNSLSQTRNQLTRFTKNIIDNNRNQQNSDEGDVQSLAKQNAKQKVKKSSKTWGNEIIQLHDYLSSLETSGYDGANITQSLSNLSHELFSAVRIIPPKELTAVSETASMPVTISNNYPYPIKVYLSADTHSMEIVTTRKTLITVAANSETQVTLPLRITTSSRAQATFVLEDMQHHAFSDTQSTTISSTLQISDKSGTIIIVFAFVLGALGLWRQFHRVKDPDE